MMNTRLIRLRQERYETIQAFSDKVGIVRSTLSELESGKREISTKHIEPLCKELEVTSDYLLNRSDEGIICKCLGRDGDIIISDFEYNHPKVANEIYVNKFEGRCISKQGEVELGILRSEEFDKNILTIMNGLSTNSYLKEIIPLLSKLNDVQLGIILQTIKAFIKG